MPTSLVPAPLQPSGDTRGQEIHHAGSYHAARLSGTGGGTLFPSRYAAHTKSNSIFIFKLEPQLCSCSCRPPLQTSSVTNTHDGPQPLQTPSSFAAIFEPILSAKSWSNTCSIVKQKERYRNSCKCFPPEMRSRINTHAWVTCQD